MRNRTGIESERGDYTTGVLAFGAVVGAVVGLASGDAALIAGAMIGASVGLVIGALLDSWADHHPPGRGRSRRGAGLT